MKNETYYQIRATKITKPPIIDGVIKADEWPEAVSKTSISSAESKQPLALKANITGAVNGKNLCLSAQVTAQSPAADLDHVVLLDDRRKQIKPTSEKYNFQKDSYTWEAQYRLNDLNLAKFEAEYKKCGSVNAPEVIPKERVIRATVDISHARDRNSTPIHLSTNLNAKGYAASILITPISGLPEFKQVDDHLYNAEIVPYLNALQSFGG